MLLKHGLTLSAVALIAYSLITIVNALPQIAAYGPSGRASVAAAALWITLGIQILVSVGLLTVPGVARSSPGAIHFGTQRFSEYTLRQRERLMPLLRQMAGLMSVAINLFCAFHVRWRVEATLSDGPRSPAPVLWSAVGLAVALAVITLYYLDRFDDEAGPP